MPVYDFTTHRRVEATRKVGVGWVCRRVGLACGCAEPACVLS